jgi:threonine-phosphate decarboxylase
MNMFPRHGGNVHAAARASGRRLDQLIDFSASINPLGPSPSALRAMLNAIPHLVHYPDPDWTELLETLSTRWRLAPDRLVIGNGSSELIQWLPRAFSIHHALIVGPTFSEYERSVLSAGGLITSIDASRTQGYRPPLEDVITLLRAARAGSSRKIDAIFLCNPNSPTGVAVGAKELLPLVKAASDAGIWTILDETFIDYCESRSLLLRIARFPRLIVLRSFTKFYGLPGLRIGYAAGSKEAMTRLRACLPPWSVNVLAQVAACAAIRDLRHARASLAFMQRERPRFVRSLRAVPGMTVYPSSANFLLVELPPFLSASDCTGALARQGLLVRDCSAVPGLNDRTLRVAIRLPAQNRKLITALRRLVKRS